MFNRLYCIRFESSINFADPRENSFAEMVSRCVSITEEAPADKAPADFEEEPDLQREFEEQADRDELAMYTHDQEEAYVQAMMQAEMALYEQDMARAQAEEIANQETYDEAQRTQAKAEKVLEDANEHMDVEEALINLAQSRSLAATDR